MIPPELHKIAALLQPASTTNPVRGWGTPVIKRPGIGQAPPAIKTAGAGIFAKLLSGGRPVAGKVTAGIGKMRGKGGMPPPAVPPPLPAMRPPNPFGSAAPAVSAAVPRTAAPATSAVAGAAPSFLGSAAKGVGRVAKGIGKVALPVGIVGSLVDASPAINAYTGLRDGASGMMDGIALGKAMDANLPMWQRVVSAINPDAAFNKGLQSVEGKLPWFTRAGFGDLTGRMADSYKRLRAAPPTLNNVTSFLPQRGSLGPYANTGDTADALVGHLQSIKQQLERMAPARGATASTLPPQQ